MKIFLLIVPLVQISVCYNILIPLPFTYRSMSNLFLAFANRLAEKGHHVTMMTPYGVSETHPNLTMIVLSEDMKMYEKHNFFTIRKTKDDPWGDPENFLRSTDIFLSDTRVKELWTMRHEFDAIITDHYIQEMAYHFLIDFDGPFIEFCTCAIEPGLVGALGNHISPAVIPSYLADGSFDHKSFWARLKNILIYPSDYDAEMAQTLPKIHAKQKRQYPQMKSYSHYRSEVSLSLINTHFTSDIVIPLLPNQIAIGCFNCATQDSIPQDILKFIEDSGTSGVIYFSLGSMVHPEHIPKDALESILKAFEKLPHRIIMKLNWEQDLPDNVITRKWLPQQDILAHPKTKLFISHCGILSVQEAKYHGVPILALPIILDQPLNAQGAIDNGIALSMEWEDLTESTLLEAIGRLINDERYTTRAKAISKLSQDQMETPMERANWWLEYTIRNHKTADVYYKGKELHVLHYRGKDLTMMQYLMVDVILFVVFVFLITVTIFWLVIQRLLTKIRRCSSKMKSS